MPKTVLVFDLDGTLTNRNQVIISPPGLADILRKLDNLGHYFIPGTGKPVAYCQTLFEENKLNDRGIIAENGGTFRRPGSKPEIIGSGIAELESLGRLIGLQKGFANVTQIIIDGKSYQVVVDPDNISTLTIFTDPSFVSHRWSFQKTIDAHFLVDSLKKIVQQNSLDKFLEVVPPFPDGGVQVIRKNANTGLPIDKGEIMNIVNQIYPGLPNQSVAMFGDGHNDVSAMMVNGVIPITFVNAHNSVIDYINQSGKGHISKYAAPDNFGIPESIIWLAKSGFFGADDDSIVAIVNGHFPTIS